MNKNKLLIALLTVIIAALAVLLIIDGSQSTETHSRTLTANLYFFNENCSTITAEERTISYENSEFIADAVLSELLKGPQNSKNKAIFNDDTKILSVIKNENTVTVDFSSEYLSDDKSKNLLTTYAVTKSLCQLNNVKSVLVTSEGREITTPEGNAIGFLSDDDIDLVTDSITKDSKRIVLYFTDKNSDVLVKENRTIKITDTQPIEQYIVNELIKGTQSDTQKNIIASDSELISAQTSDNTCFVNFKSGFIEKNTGNQKNEKLIIYSIVNSLCEIDGIDYVQFLIDGKKIDKFGSMDFSDIFTENRNIVKEN